MRVACWCGTDFEADTALARCPECGEVACVPGLTYREITEMTCDVAEVLAEHEPYEPPRIA